MGGANFTVAPGGIVGILGGGQLGRMLAMAAARLGLKTIIYAPDEKCPAADVACDWVQAEYLDEAALAAFAKRIDVATIEFENVPAKTLRLLTEAGVPTAPGPRAVDIAQDRADEKAFFAKLGVATAPYEIINGPGDLAPALEKLGGQGILKTRRLGYDGKGQVRLAAGDDLGKAWAEVGATPSILEGFVSFTAETSLIAARDWSGDIAFFDMGRNTHEGGILRRTETPAPEGLIADEIEAAAKDAAEKALSALDYVGVIAIEFFITECGDLIANEFAPRVHNSGHWTLDACAVSQFEQHIRAVCGWPLGDSSRFADAVMENLIGKDATNWRALAARQAAAVHLYGKDKAAPGRKMGHITVINPK